MNERKRQQIDIKSLLRTLSRYKYVFLVIVAGVLLLTLPRSDTDNASAAQMNAEEEDFSVNSLECQLCEILSQINGAGQVRVMLTVESGMKRVFAQDSMIEQESDAARRETKTVIVSYGSGTEDAVLVQQIYPKFQGALVVADGGGDPSVKLELTKAVAALTGLGSDKISVCKGK